MISKYKNHDMMIKMNFYIKKEVVCTTVVISGIVYTYNLKELREVLKRFKDKYSSQHRHKSRKKRLKIAKWTGRNSKFEIVIFIIVVVITADVFFIRKPEFKFWRFFI
ncbi:hypothetical protein C1645_771313 [Glomus cerebriforme]|uniref:Uncharacterized protein n=1 Tax=Glomus cerebriforme TaxID=658196 RepID=A0A397T0W3_9GLOM|nr:hypothetical protein C1645_771313 [Glomus cerebriforme]